MDNKEKWIEGVFDSMKNSERAMPSLELFNKIKQKISATKTMQVSIYQWKWIAAAAALIFLINSITILNYANNKKVSYENFTVVDSYEESLVSSFNIYE